MASGTTDVFGNAGSSLLKTKKPSIAEKKAAVSPEKEAVIETIKTFPTNGFSNLPTVQPASIRPVDYYRNGKKLIGPTQQNGEAFNIQPREFGDFEDREEPASIRLVGKLKKGSNSQDQDLLPPYTKFLLEGVSEAHTERSQIVETFGDFYVFFFGERPPIYTYTGTFINTALANWTQDFMLYYDKFLRGTKSVENNARIVMTYGGRSVEGFILNVSTQTSSNIPGATSFSFQVLILDRKVMQVSRDFGLVADASTIFSNSASFFVDFLAKAGLSNKDTSKAWNIVENVVNKKKNPVSVNIPTINDAEELSKTYLTKLGTSLSGKIIPI